MVLIPPRCILIVIAEGNCPNSYAYAFDEPSGDALFTCDSNLAADYTLTFCPWSTQEQFWFDSSHLYTNCCQSMSFTKWFDRNYNQRRMLPILRIPGLLMALDLLSLWLRIACEDSQYVFLGQKQVAIDGFLVDDRNVYYVMSPWFCAASAAPKCVTTRTSTGKYDLYVDCISCSATEPALYSQCYLHWPVICRGLAQIETSVNTGRWSLAKTPSSASEVPTL